LLPVEHPERIEAELQHARLRECISKLRTMGQLSVPELHQFCFLLNEHIRYEERILFGTVERETAPEVLKKIEKMLAREKPAGIHWENKFWLN
jgi:hypothetical protein